MQLKIAAALLMTSPFVPMLFQGEEWNASSPFQYFTDHQDPRWRSPFAKAAAREFAHFVADASEVPDPQALETFERSKLDWDEREHGRHREILEWYRQLVASSPTLRDFEMGELDLDAVNFDEAARWICVSRGESVVTCNLRDDSATRTCCAGGESHCAFRSRPETGVRLDGARDRSAAGLRRDPDAEDRDRSTGVFE